MNVASAVLVVVGGVVGVLAGIGLLRFRTPLARLHAAGKASPVAFLLIAAGAALELGGTAAARLVVASLGVVLTLPIAVHLLFRAVHRTGSNEHLSTDDLAGPSASGS